jgi:hypothetical protein
MMRPLCVFLLHFSISFPLGPDILKKQVFEHIKIAFLPKGKRSWRFMNFYAIFKVHKILMLNNIFYYTKISSTQ